MRTLGVVLVTVSAALAGCAQDPSTMARVPTSGPRPEAIDGRTGVLAVVALREDARYETTLGRVEGAGYVTLSPPIPDGGEGRIDTVRWFADGALAGDLDGRLFRLSAGAWEALSLASCDPERPAARLADAVALDDAWIVASDPATQTATLCHFDGAALTPEPLPFAPAALLETEGMLVAVTTAGELRRRPREGGSWSSVDGFFELGTQLVEASPRDEAIFLHFARAYDDVGRWWRVTGSDAARVPEGIPGMNGELWRIESTEHEVEECSYSLWSGRDICTTYVEVAEHRVLRVEGDEPVEVGFLHLDRFEVTDLVPLVLGPGQLALAGSSGQLWVTLAE